MKFHLIITRDPHLLPLAIPTIKEYLKIEHDQENELLSKLAYTACDAFEKYTNIALSIKEYQITYNQLFSYQVKIPILPIHQIIEVISLYPIEGRLKLNPKAYELCGNSLYLKQSIYHDSLLIRLEAGFAADNLPADIGNLLLNHIAFLYEHRGSNQQYDLKHYQPFMEYRL